MEIKPLVRKANYYETDAMGIIHHSNYIRWFEEARCDLMEQIGYSYARMEADGIGSPVLGVSCEYKVPVRYGDTVVIGARIAAFTGTRLTMAYTITDSATGELRTTGETRHCFTQTNGRPVSMKRSNPSAYTLFTEVMEQQKQG